MRIVPACLEWDDPTFIPHLLIKHRRIVVYTGCWEWTGITTAAGYGMIGHRDSREYVHRVSYQHSIGPIPIGMHVCHHCDNPGCFNPKHLFIGTAKDNIIDASRKGRLIRKKKISDESVADIILLRRHGKLLQKDLAVRFGISKSQVGLILSGKRRSGIKSLEALLLRRKKILEKDGYISPLCESKHDQEVFQ